MIDVTDRAHVAVRLVPLKFRFAHDMHLISSAEARLGRSFWRAPSPLPGVPTQARLSGQRLERVKGIEPSSSAWKAVALPLSYTRIRETEDRTGIGTALSTF